MTSRADHRPGRRVFVKSVGTAALLSGVGAIRGASAHPTPSRPGREGTTVWIVDFLLPSGRAIDLFAREADAKRHAINLIRREIEGRSVGDPTPVLERVAAGDLDGAIAAYRSDQRYRVFGGELRIFEQRVSAPTDDDEPMSA